MPLSGTHTAILVFVRNEGEESHAKRFTHIGGSRANRRIVRVLNQRVEQLARATGLPTVVLYGEQQVGSCFGERFSNAIESLFDGGFQRVISVGNDCLSLDQSHLLEVSHKLESAPLVLGPTYDGGAYVIGIDRSVFRQEVFRDLPWQCSELLPALIEYGRDLGSAPFLMPPRWDADDAVSFARAFATLTGNHPLVRLLRSLLLSAQRPARRSIISVIQILLHTPLLRGPPPAFPSGISPSFD